MQQVHVGERVSPMFKIVLFEVITGAITFTIFALVAKNPSQNLYAMIYMVILLLAVVVVFIIGIGGQIFAFLVLNNLMMLCVAIPMFRGPALIRVVAFSIAAILFYLLGADFKKSAIRYASIHGLSHVQTLWVTRFPFIVLPSVMLLFALAKDRTTG